MDSTDALSRYIYIYIYRYIDVRPYVHRYCACAALRANVAGQIGNRFCSAESAFSVQLSQHFQPASDRDRVRPESRGGALSRHP